MNSYFNKLRKDGIQHIIVQDVMVFIFQVLIPFIPLNNLDP